MGVANLGIDEYLTDEVHRLLNLQGVSWLLPLDDEGGAYNMVACCDVEEERFSPFRSDKDWADVSDALRLYKAYCASFVQMNASIFLRSL